MFENVCSRGCSRGASKSRCKIGNSDCRWFDQHFLQMHRAPLDVCFSTVSFTFECFRPPRKDLCINVHDDNFAGLWFFLFEKQQVLFECLIFLHLSLKLNIDIWYFYIWFQKIYIDILTIWCLRNGINGCPPWRRVQCCDLEN